MGLVGCLLGWLVPWIDSCFELYILGLVQMESLDLAAPVESTADNG